MLMSKYCKQRFPYTASHDNHGKINSPVSFAFLYMGKGPRLAAFRGRSSAILPYLGKLALNLERGGLLSPSPTHKRNTHPNMLRGKFKP